MLFRKYFACVYYPEGNFKIIKIFEILKFPIY